MATLKIGFIGYGEVGQTFAQELACKADVRVVVFDILFDSEKGRDLRRRAEQATVRTASTTANLCKEVDVIISAVTADSAIDAAEQSAPYLNSYQTYIDLNSVSPATKNEIYNRVSQSGANFVEFAVMAAVSGVGIAVPILAGGEKAEHVAAALNKLGMDITPVSAGIGLASATKLCRSIVIKGLEALMIDFTVAAQRAGVMPAVLDSLRSSYPGMEWDQVAKAMISRVRKHGVRRAAEMREASRMIEELGLDGSLVSAIANRLESFANQHEQHSIAERSKDDTDSSRSPATPA